MLGRNVYQWAQECGLQVRSSVLRLSGSYLFNSRHTPAGIQAAVRMEVGEGRSGGPDWETEAEFWLFWLSQH